MSTPNSAPTRFGYKVAVIVALGFAAFAAWPYLSRAAERAAQGQPVTAEALKNDVEKAAKEKEKKMEKEKMEKEKGFEPKAVLALGDGSVLIGGKGGLKTLRGDKLEPVAGFGGYEVRGLAQARDGALYAAAKDGLWKRTGEDWKNVREGDFHGVSTSADGAVFLAGKMGVLRSADGANFEPVKGTETGWKPEEKHGQEKPDGEKAAKEKKD
jgi:hypothetical protein